VLLMGRRTYDSIGRPLPGRTSVVVTRQRQWEAPAQVVVCHDVDTAVAEALALDDEVFVIGGAEVYRQTLSRADRLVLTWVHQSPEGDTWFPRVDWDSWQETRREPQPGFDIVTYVRR
jgi:dihydrofolate reductase